MEKFNLLKTAKGYEVKNEAGEVILKRETHRIYYGCTIGKNQAGKYVGLNWYGRPDLFQKGLSRHLSPPAAIATIEA